MKKTKKEWVKWFNSLDDDAKIEFNVSAISKQYEKGELKKIRISV